MLNCHTQYCVVEGSFWNWSLQCSYHHTIVRSNVKPHLNWLNITWKQGAKESMSQCAELCDLWEQWPRGHTVQKGSLGMSSSSSCLMESELSDFNAERYGRPPQIDFFFLWWLLYPLATQAIFDWTRISVISRLNGFQKYQKDWTLWKNTQPTCGHRRNLPLEPTAFWILKCHFYH